MQDNDKVIGEKRGSFRLNIQRNLVLGGDSYVEEG